MTLSEELRASVSTGPFDPHSELRLRAANELEALREEVASTNMALKASCECAEQFKHERDTLRTQSAALRESFVAACIEPVYESRQYGTPGRLLCLRCRLCGSECQNHGEMNHDTACVLHQALTAQPP